jgi:hypothetical protein
MAKKFVEPEYDVYKVDEVELVLERDFYIVGNNKIGNSKDAAEIFRQFWNENLINIQEQFSVMLLSQSNKVIGMYQHSKGAINSTVADVELIAAVAVKSLAKGVIVAHNHPSGALTPSQADITLTKRLKEALALFQINLLDSLIIVQDKTTYYSLSDSGDFADGGVIIGDNSVKEEYIIKDGATKEESIEYLIKRKEDILNKVNPLIKKHKKMYSNMDISSSKSIEEKKSEKEIQDLLSEANEIVFKIRKMQKQVPNRSKMAMGGNLGADKHRIYFSSFAEVMEAINDIAKDNGYKVVDIFPDLSYGGVGYGQTKRAQVELESDGSEKRGKSKSRDKNTLNVQIYRMDSGNYELNSYFSYKQGGMMNGGLLDVGKYYRTKSGKQVRYLGKTKDPEVGTFTNKADGVFKVRYDEIEGKASLFGKGGYMAKGGKIYKIQSKDKNDIIPKWKDDTWYTNGKKYLSYKDSQNEVKKLQGDNSLYFMEFRVVEDKEKMAMGGKTFEGKVKSIKKSLLERKKVPKSVQKDYGKTFSPKEAEDSAKRIVGSLTARERMKSKIKK